jgi:L-lactate dehydrogenase complex protein LldE
VGKKVAYFAGCLVNTIQPEVGKATVRLLRHLGFAVEVVEQKCCGQPFLSTGNMTPMHELARFNVNVLAETEIDVLTSCPSCARTIKKDYPRHGFSGGLPAFIGDLTAVEFTVCLYATIQFFTCHNPPH